MSRRRRQLPSACHEDGALTAYVYIDLNSRNYGDFVKAANASAQSAMQVLELAKTEEKK